MTKRKVTDIATVVNHLMRQTAVLLTKDLSKAGGRQAAAPAQARGQRGEVPVTPASAKRVAESVNRSAAVTVDRIMQMKYAYPFNAPVDAEALGLGDYFKVITHPMDLGTIMKRLESGQSHHPKTEALLRSEKRTHRDQDPCRRRRRRRRFLQRNRPAPRHHIERRRQSGKQRSAFAELPRRSDKPSRRSDALR